MGQQALQHTAPVQRQVHSTNASGTVQLMKVALEKDAKTKLGKGNEKAMQKLHALAMLIEDAIGDLFPKNTISIEIINDGEMSPAWNHHKGSKTYPGTEGDIGVQLNKWYLEKASLGDLLGMFNHEIGVHSLSSLRMGTIEHGTKATIGSNAHHESLDEVNEHNKNPLGATIAKFPTDKEKTGKGRKRQRDHVNLAKSLSGGVSQRGQHYIDLYLRTGDSLEKNTKDPRQLNSALKDLTQYFLFDIARIVATDDGNAPKLFWNTGNIGRLMVYYRTDFVKKYGGAHKWLKDASTDITTGKWQIRGWLLGQLGKMAVSSNPAVQKVRSAAIGLGVAAYVGGGILGIASLPALGAGLLAGGLAYGAQKALGW